MRRSPDSVIDSDAHRQLALKTARESMVLLKNDGAAAAERKTNAQAKKIAVVGPLADSVHVLEGNYSGTPSRSTTALDGIRKQFSASQVTFAPGTNFLLEYAPVPASALSTPDGKPGLKAEYFSDPAFNGAPVKVAGGQGCEFQLCPGHDLEDCIFRGALDRLSHPRRIRKLSSGPGRQP